MEFIEFKSIKSLFKEKINPKLTKNRLRKSNFTRLPYSYKTDNRNNSNISFTKRNKNLNYIRNKDISIYSNFDVSNTNDERKNKNILDKINLSYKNSLKNKTRKMKSKINTIQNYNTSSVNRSLNLLNPNYFYKNEPLINKINNYNKINSSNISYITKTPKNKLILQKKNKMKEKTKIILVQKNKNFFGKSQIIKPNIKINYENNKNINFYNNNYNKNNNNEKDYTNKNIVPYKKKKIMNKQFLNLRLNFINDSQNLNPIEHCQYTSNINNLEIYNILTKSQDNLINKNQQNPILNNYMNDKCNSVEKRKLDEVNSNENRYSQKNINLGIDTNHYNVKNININFNNIKVVNNISKRCSSQENNKKRKCINHNAINNRALTLKNEEEYINTNILQNNEIEKDNNHSKNKIKVCKTKSSLKISDEIKNSTNNIKVMKRKIIKGKSQNNLKIKKLIKIMKIDSCTIEGKSFKQKYNQENFFMKEKFLNKKEQFLIGICNGHGKNGKLISKYVLDSLPALITDTSDISIINSYLQMNKQIISENNKKFDCSLSGASCISLIISLEKIISANLGDNKAVLARYENGLYNYINLNREHKPTTPDEKKRILEHNGKIGYLYGNTEGPKKIWLKNSDIPGLHISRSFGDVIAHNVGVISEPEIKNFYYNGNEKFIILASHGFWDLIDSKESIEIVKEYYENNMDAIGALNKLALVLLNKSENQKKSINDDITIIIVFFG